ncbi:hypothetical protein ACMGDK_09600 [Chryseobacterium sp. DT-3]|uniref:hypothetical protein n=1 Tax=Chryseobacterium sp. DT-3 TaxID=3396164 RepID=UPI003F1C8EA8
MNIGVITYKQYDENVLLNAHFNLDELFRIILHDKEFIKFEIFDRERKLLASTYYPDVEKGKGFHILLFKVEREEEIKWIDYYAFRTPSTIRHTTVRWKVRGADLGTKKKATEFVNSSNNRVAGKLEEFIDRNSF